MFTGIIEEVGTVTVMDARDAGSRLRIQCRTVMEDATPGCSIAVNGVCLTAVDLMPDSFAADLAPETLLRSNLGDLLPGSTVNLERPISAAGRLSGHIVQGHVDATGEFLSMEDLGSDNWWLKVRVPEQVEQLLVWKGSIAIDGISLTVASLEGDILGVTIVPHTIHNTTLGSRKPGGRVNIECDILAKYAAKLLGRLDTNRMPSVL
ncbi:MAG: riboflavin synthase [Candidatus Solibacter usitatus]|nr:riboflavin synthase [Candidatus Solibacter usitatus]